ncbi:probable mitochondrial-processing peptidase subunit alpha-1, mitochondrial [Melitaea cinxia]|uniref:probable mitochondrial-processing peptidase subunit alpha-1, mitochondrial n=1 Tax=Melitaea cinxia TaxID=113334 RepID=UPI001E2741C0|nr:probable mitochondrial-processing peptidase subunit alpha-1, mitochondrial [Melitaea cinxia]
MKTIIPILFNNVNKLSTCNLNGAICWPKPSYGPMETHRSELMNGIKIVAAKTSGALMVACTIMFQAGSRYESPDFLGATHFLRAASTGSGCCYTAFSKLRVLQQRGAYLTCSSDRQSISYTLRSPLPYFGDLKYYLLDTAARCCYHDWEISDRKSLVRGDLARMNPEERVIDLIQKAFWAGPLANSIYCEDERIDDMSGELLNKYVNTYFKSTNCCVASVGIPFEETMMLADKIDTRRERPVLKPHPKSRPRAGFEYYDLGSGSDTWIAVAVPGCGTDDITNLYKHAIIASACGTGNMQQGQHELDRIPQPPLGFMSGDDIFTNFRAFNISYADTGIFGIIAKTRSETATRSAYAVAEFLSNVGDLDFKQIQDGKKRLQLDLAIHEEDCVKVVEGFALQLANDVRIDSLQESLNMIDTISPDEVKATAMCLARSSNEMAVAVVGDLSVVPNDHEILKK